jgi:hypothetical protein
VRRQKCPVGILFFVGTLTVLDAVYHDVPQSLQPDARIVPEIRLEHSVPYSFQFILGCHPIIWCFVA